MALPKRKHSQSRRNKRRSHWTLPKGNLTTCPQCARAIRPHHVCPFCGSYRGRQVITVAKKDKKDER